MNRRTLLALLFFVACAYSHARTHARTYTRKKERKRHFPPRWSHTPIAIVERMLATCVVGKRVRETITNSLYKEKSKGIQCVVGLGYSIFHRGRCIPNERRHRATWRHSNVSPLGVDSYTSYHFTLFCPPSTNSRIVCLHAIADSVLPLQSCRDRNAIG